LVIIDTHSGRGAINRSVLRAVTHVVCTVVPNMVNIQTAFHRDNLEILQEDSIIGPLLTDFYIGERIAFPTIDKPNISPDTIWKFKNYPEARKEAYQLCEFVEKKIFGTGEEGE